MGSPSCPEIDFIASANWLPAFKFVGNIFLTDRDLIFEKFIASANRLPAFKSIGNIFLTDRDLNLCKMWEHIESSACYALSADFCGNMPDLYWYFLFVSLLVEEQEDIISLSVVFFIFLCTSFKLLCL